MDLRFARGSASRTSAFHRFDLAGAQHPRPGTADRNPRPFLQFPLSRKRMDGDPLLCIEERDLYHQDSLLDSRWIRVTRERGASHYCPTLSHCTDVSSAHEHRVFWPTCFQLAVYIVW
jgi:hypothetical protein